MKASVSCVTGFLLCLVSASVYSDVQCEGTIAGQKQVYWGDLHVHSGYSLDAYSFGTLNTPAEAYAFARGEPLEMADGSIVQLDRPLDFTAVTDHAEWFDFMYVCTDPVMSDHPDCQNLRDHASPDNGLNLFRQYVVPSITLDHPQVLPPCAEDEAACNRASGSQWQRVQAQANAANAPCEFTSFVGYEWSATRKFRHTHRNVIFASDQVPDEAFDYMRYPTLTGLFSALEANCRPEDGCDVITIPHNSNMGDGTTFDVELESERALMLRRRFERLIEVHQEKGNSECLSPLGVTDETDCNFEVRLTRLSRPAVPDDYNSAEWEHMRATYVRSLLLRGLAGYLRSGAEARNPLRLGMIGSTDGHAATPGFVSESAWPGPVFGLGSLDAAMSRQNWNPGGLVAVRAEENTRGSLFAAMKRREVYATSGPRMILNVESDASPLSCEPDAPAGAVPMGGAFDQGAPYFRVTVTQDQLPIQKVEMIKGTIVDGIFEESVNTLWEGESANQCIEWQDPLFAEGQPAFWYVRVHEVQSPRWSSHHCRAEKRCEEFPGADTTVAERAWSSPIWYLPVITEDVSGEPASE